MGTSKHVAILLTAALTGLLTAGQDQPTASSQAAPRGPSNMRSASCIVRITVDPAILPLNGETVDSLIHSPAVLLKAGRDVLSLNTPDAFNKLIESQDSGRPLLTIKWLNGFSAPRSPAAKLSDQEAFRRQMEDIYGPAYAQQMMGSPGEEKKGGAPEGEASGSSQKDGSSDREGRSATRGMGAGGGVIGIGSRARQIQGQSTGALPRQPGESDVAYRTRVAQVRSQQKALQEMKSRGMGGVGGGMGGYGMGGMGMGGMGGGYGGMGGMMGGYGGMGGMGFSYGTPSAPRQDAGAAQSATIELQVNLPDTVPALVDAFMKGIVRNLRDSLSQAHEAYRGDLQAWLNVARDQRHGAEAALDETPEDPRVTQEVQRRLNTTVDLSALNPQMPLSDAVDLLKKSVDPPLNIVVLWRNLADYVQVEPTTPVNIDGMSSVRLGTALDLLVKGIPNRLGAGGPTWKIKDNVIVIGTVIALTESRDAGAMPRSEADAVNLAGQRSELTRRVQALELDLAGLEARWQTIVHEIPDIKKQVDERLSQDAALRELDKLTKIYTGTTQTPEGRLVTPDSAEGQQNMIRARIELANRREELSKQAGGNQLDEFNKELTRIVIDRAEKEAQLKTVRKQLDEVQKQLVQALTFDPEAARLRLAQESLDVTARRIAELQTQIANLQPPMVTVIGAN